MFCLLAVLLAVSYALLTAKSQNIALKNSLLHIRLLTPFDVKFCSNDHHLRLIDQGFVILFISSVFTPTLAESYRQTRPALAIFFEAMLSVLFGLITLSKLKKNVILV